MKWSEVQDYSDDTFTIIKAGNKTIDIQPYPGVEIKVLVADTGKNGKVLGIYLVDETGLSSRTHGLIGKW
jgi:hypothetical protein